MAILLKGAGTYKRAFLMVLASDHISPATGLTPVVSISKAGGAFGAPSISANATEITASGPGWYYISLSSTDTNTAGDLVVHAAVATADNTDFVDQVWDSTVAMTGVNVVNWLGTVVATPATAGIPDINVKNAGNTAWGSAAITAGAVSAGANQAIADAVLDRDMSVGTDSGSTSVRTIRQAMRFLRNKWSISGTTLTVTKEDDATASWTSTLVGTPGASPVTSSDPAGP